MPVKKSAFKELRKGAKRATHNKKIKSDITALVKKVYKSIDKGESDKAKDWLKQAIKKLDKAASKKVMKKNTAARKKSRLSVAVSKISTKK